MHNHSCGTVPKYRLEKLSIGFVSVMFGFLVVTGANSVASADTVNNNNEPVETSPVVLSTSVAASQSSNVINTSLATSSVANSQMSSQSVVSQASQVSESAIVTGSNEQSTIASQVAPLAPAMPVEMAQMQMLNVQSAVSNLSNNQIQVSAVQDNTSNGGFDSNTWGTLDVSKWQVHVVSNTDIDGVTRQYYELTGYIGDMNHIIVPNEADLEAAGINTGGHQVGINADTTHSWFENGDPKTIAFSKTDNKMVKALGSDWTSAFTGAYDRRGRYIDKSHALGEFDGANLSISNVTNMSYMFMSNQISDLTPLTNWKIDRVTRMSNMFSSNRISDLTPLASWNTDKVTDMSDMFSYNRISDLTPLANWKTDNVTNMYSMFDVNQISDLTPLASWKTDKVTNMGQMFSYNQISDLTPLANWKTDNAIYMGWMFNHNQVSDLTPLANWKTDKVTDMNNMFANNQVSDLIPLANWKTDNVTNMSSMFFDNQISNLTPLASWKTGNVTDISYMFAHNQISDLTSLDNWKTDNVTNMSSMFFDNQISDLATLANWNTDKVINMSGMFDDNQISDLTPLTNWKTDNVTNMGNVFAHNRISDLTPLSSWKTDKVTDMSYIFYDNQISDLTPFANWKTDKVTDMHSMFESNQIKLADFRKWNFSQSKYLGRFISQLNYMDNVNSIVLVSSKDLSLLSGKSKAGVWDSTLSSVVDAKSNSIFINSALILMPTIYATDDMTTPAEKLAEKLVEQARAQKIADYQKAHPTAKISLITPDPTNHAYDTPAIMANQKYRVSNKVTYQFIDDDNNGVKVGNVVIVSGEDGSIQKTNLVLPKYYDLVAWQILPYVVVIPTSDTTVTLHLVHTQYNVVIKYLDLSGSQVGSQTVTGQWGSTQKVGTLQIPQNYVLQSVNVPTEVEIQPEDTELDLVVAPTETYRSFVTSKDVDLHRSVTRVITVTLPDKSTKTVVQTVNFGRNAWTNDQTHQVTYSDWQADGPQKFVAYIPDAVSGYVPGVVKSQQVLADSQNVMVSVGYTPIQQAVKHPYIDASGHVYDTIPTGYHVVAGQTPLNGAMLLVKDVVAKPVTVDFVTRTVTIKMPNNHVRVIHQRVRKGTQFGKIAVPHLRGYKIAVSNNAGLGRVAADQDMNLTVTFEKL